MEEWESLSECHYGGWGSVCREEVSIRELTRQIVCETEEVGKEFSGETSDEGRNGGIGRL